MIAPATRAGDLLRSYGYTSLFCAAIAGLLWALTREPFLPLLSVSFSIGLSIATAFALLQAPVGRYLSPYLAPVPITLVGLLAGLTLGGTLLGDPGFFFDEAWDTWIVGVFFGAVGFLLVSTHGRLQSLRAALAQAEAAQLQQEKLRLESDLRLLQAQIEPHFLFNTLSNVASMIREAPDEAEATLENLTTLLRSSLRRTRTTLTTLDDELDIVRSYLEIQRIRMGDRLRYRIEVAEDCGQVPLPPLLLQPLVENAVRHGVEPLEQGADLTIRIVRHDGSLTIEVADTGVGLPSAGGPEPSRLPPTRNGSTNGAGIANVIGRLDGLYHGAARLEFSSNSPRGLVAVLTLPEKPDAESAAG
ncbi:MAG: histidine kinase [Pseudomonadales bacterium]